MTLRVSGFFHVKVTDQVVGIEYPCIAKISRDARSPVELLVEIPRSVYPDAAQAMDNHSVEFSVEDEEIEHFLRIVNYPYMYYGEKKSLFSRN